MISLWIVILSFAIIFTGLYFVYKMNKNDDFKPGGSSRRHHPKT